MSSPILHCPKPRLPWRDRPLAVSTRVAMPRTRIAPSTQSITTRLVTSTCVDPCVSGSTLMLKAVLVLLWTGSLQLDGLFMSVQKLKFGCPNFAFFWQFERHMTLQKECGVMS